MGGGWIMSKYQFESIQRVGGAVALRNADAGGRGRKRIRQSGRLHLEALEAKLLLTSLDADFDADYGAWDDTETEDFEPPDVAWDTAGNLVFRPDTQGDDARGSGTANRGRPITGPDTIVNSKGKLDIVLSPTQARRANGEVIPGVKVKPLVATYMQRHPTTNAFDIYAAVSLDDGQTWKRSNLSDSADRSSFTLANGAAYPGDAQKHVVQVKGRYILVAWTSKYAPRPDPTNIGTGTDLYQVKGPQRSVDYTDMGFPEKGEVPYSAVWINRGIIQADGEITWFKPEQLTSGRRDALQVNLAAVGKAGLAVAWQEDPEGLRPGSGYGPGDGWSGATVNHKTDIWYSQISWNDFDDVQTVATTATGQGATFAAIPFSSPVRLTDNHGVKVEKLNSGMAPPIYHKVCQRDDDGNFVEVNGFAVTKPEYGGQVLDGNTGSSRVNMFMQPVIDPATNQVITAEVILGYEETKGLGSGPPIDPHDPDGASTKPGVVGVDTGDIEDIGKYAVYHHYADFRNPLVISSGDILNLPNEDGEYENARRIRFAVQPQQKAGPSGTVLVAMYRQGEEGKGRPADVFMRRAVNGYAFADFVDGAINVTSAEVLSTTTTPTEGDKVTDWTWTVDNLQDQSATNPFEDSRAHRAQLRGDSLVFGYTWTPNWAPARNAKDKYDFFVRRSFDGGQSWSTEDGDWEVPRNLSNLPNAKFTVIEPRLMATPGTITNSNGAPTGNPEDVQNPYVFFASYGTAINVPQRDDDDAPQDAMQGVMADIYYARTTDFGATYEMIDYPQGRRFDWLARGDLLEQGEAQLRMTPAGNALYATWLQNERVTGPESGRSDIWFRKISYPMVSVDGTVTGGPLRALDLPLFGGHPRGLYVRNRLER